LSFGTGESGFLWIGPRADGGCGRWGDSQNAILQGICCNGSELLAGRRLHWVEIDESSDARSSPRLRLVKTCGNKMAGAVRALWAFTP
jgi:hypothetical protein